MDTTYDFDEEVNKELLIFIHNNRKGWKNMTWDQIVAGTNEVMARYKKAGRKLEDTDMAGATAYQMALFGAMIETGY